MTRTKWMMAALLLTAGLSAAAVAQSVSHPWMTGDNNMRTSMLVGMAVYNDNNEKIGTIEEILIPSAGGDVTAVVSVGGFLGTGQKLIKGPLSHFRLMSDKAMMADGGKPALMKMPAYSYTHRGGG